MRRQDDYPDYFKVGNVKVPYSETITNVGYFYILKICYHNRPGKLFLCEFGMHVEWDDEPNKYVALPLIPAAMFPWNISLGKSHLKHILLLLAKNGFDGKSMSNNVEELTGLSTAS